MEEKTIVPLWHKHLLTVKEASQYFNIGEKKLRQLINENNDASYLLNNGTKILIKRGLFEQFLNEISSI